jgi:hypothetical protein
MSRDVLTFQAEDGTHFHAFWINTSETMGTGLSRSDEWADIPLFADCTCAEPARVTARLLRLGDDRHVRACLTCLAIVDTGLRRDKNDYNSFDYIDVP